MEPRHYPTVFKTLPDCLEDTALLSSRHCSTVFKTLNDCVQDTRRLSSRHWAIVFKTEDDCLQDGARPSLPLLLHPLPSTKHEVDRTSNESQSSSKLILQVPRARLRTGLRPRTCRTFIAIGRC